MTVQTRLVAAASGRSVTTTATRASRSPRSPGRLDRAEATVKAYLYDPTGEKARDVKSRYRGACRSCGAPTSARGGKDDAYEYCKRCHPGAIAPEWTREQICEAMRAWQQRYGSVPTSYDWSRTHARRRGHEALRRLQGRPMAAGEHRQ